MAQYGWMLKHVERSKKKTQQKIKLEGWAKTGLAQAGGKQT